MEYVSLVVRYVILDRLLGDKPYGCAHMAEGTLVAHIRRERVAT